MSTAERLRELLGEANKFGEYAYFVCPRCGRQRTHCTPSVNAWRCWGCESWGKADQLAALPRRPASAPASSKPELPRRRVTSIPTRLDAVPIGAHS